MMKKSWFAFLIYFVVAHSGLLATKQSPSKEELKFQNHMKVKALEYQQSFVPMTFLPNLCSCGMAGGLGMGTLNAGLGAIAIVPEAVICSHAAGSVSCTLSGLIGGIIGGCLFVTSLGGTGVLVTYRYIKVRNYNNTNIKHHIELANLIETAFNYDDFGPIKYTPENAETDEEAVLIADADNDAIHEMINNYHRTNPTYEISAAELARRIRQAVFAGYFTPTNMVNVAEAGKWADMRIDALITNIMIKFDALKAYYEDTKKNNDTLYAHWEKICRAKNQVDACVIDLSTLQ